MTENKRGVQHPSHALDVVVEWVKQLRERIGEGPFDRDSIAAALGHKNAKGGAALTKIGAINHFGMLEGGNNKYKLSTTARRILYPTSEEDHHQALADACHAPALYERLFSTYDGMAVPTMLPNLLIQTYGVNSSSAESAADTFRKSAEYAGLLRNGILHEKPVRASAADDEPKSNSISPSMPPASPEARNVQGGMVGQKSPNMLGGQMEPQYTLPLSGGRVVSMVIPRGINAKDLVRIKDWLDVMADVLTEVEAAEGGET